MVYLFMFTFKFSFRFIQYDSCVRVLSIAGRVFCLFDYKIQNYITIPNFLSVIVCVTYVYVCLFVCMLGGLECAQVSKTQNIVCI